MQKNLIVFVGSRLWHNEPFYDYCLRHAKKNIDQTDTLLHIDSNKLLVTLERILEDNTNVLIFASDSAFATVSKLLATLSGDKLELKSEMLIPKNTAVYESRSYIIETRGARINVLHALENKKLPPVLFEALQTQNLHIFDMDAESIEILLEPLTKSFDVAIDYSVITKDWIKLTCKSRQYGEINHFLASAKKLFSGRVCDAKNLFKYLINRLERSEKTITFAESCTGGLLAANLVAQSGSSAVLKGSLVTYSNTTKHEWIGVDEEVFERFGAVSKECVQQMLEGSLQIANAHYSVAISGIAGPGGATEYKPVGTVVIGVAKTKGQNVQTEIEEFHFAGDRNYVQKQAMYSAVKMLLLSDRDTFL